MTDTLFQKIIDREIPAEIIYEDELSMAFKDINPVAPNHVLIIPKKHIPKISDADLEDKDLLGHLMYVAGEVARDLELKMRLGWLLITERMLNKQFFIYIYT